MLIFMVKTLNFCNYPTLLQKITGRNYSYMYFPIETKEINQLIHSIGIKSTNTRTHIKKLIQILYFILFYIIFRK